MMSMELVIEELAKDLRGRLVQPDDPDYDDARAVWNGMIDRRPAAIACCAGAADVRAAVDFAHQHGLPVTVKAGGHGVAGKAICDDGLVIDVSSMNSVQVNPATQTGKVGAGATWGEFDREAQAFGLATTGGVDSRTGVAGLTLGGGLGYLARK
ncbi:MAG: FAD-dependent oxidoreductase, partial [Chloroflexota bacterium]